MRRLRSRQIERRQEVRIPVKGRAQIFFQGKKFSSGLRDLSASGVLVEINTEDLSFTPNDSVVIKVLNGERSVTLVCHVRHVDVQKEKNKKLRRYYVGLECTARESAQIDLMSLLLHSGLAQLTAETEMVHDRPVTCKNSLIINSLREGIRCSAMQRVSGPDELSAYLEELSSDTVLPLQKDLWQIAIMLRSEAMTIQFRVDYNPKDVRNILSERKSWAKAQADDRLIHDYMREYCNLTAGAVKVWIANHAAEYKQANDLRVQLPELAPKWEEAPDISSLVTHMRDRWQLCLPSGAHLFCSADISITDWSALNSMAPSLGSQEAINQSQDEGIEFL